MVLNMQSKNTLYVFKIALQISIAFLNLCNTDLFLSRLYYHIIHVIKYIESEINIFPKLRNIIFAY